MSIKLEIFTLGGVRILLGGTRIQGIGYRKAEAVLIYLASKRQPQPREVLADLLWDERTQSQALANLRLVLTTLRRTFGEYLDISHTAVSMDPDALVWMDSNVLDEKLSGLHKQGMVTNRTATGIAEALSLYRGDFLQGFTLTDCQGFEDWEVRERERLHQQAVDGYCELVNYEIEQGQYQLGLSHATRLLELDPLEETAHRQMMLLLAYCGQRSAALAQFKTCQNLLHDELGVEPADETIELYERIHAGELSTRQPLVSISLQNILDSRLDNLPVSPTSFIGRDKEIGQVEKLLSTSRLVTLTGTGGVGKTRLALEVCTNVRSDYLHGVWLVSLAPLAEARDMLPTIATVFNIRESSERLLLDVLLDYLKQKELLLLLDNCEHLVDECAHLAETILKNAVQVHILTTSREALGIDGETTFRLPSLSVPSQDEARDIDLVKHNEAVRLFIDRAMQSSPGFVMTDENASTIAKICQQLDGIPLALELAAARVKHITVDQISNRLEQDFNLLTRGNRTALPRHKTLRATFDWSYNLLTEPERILFRRLAVFTANWDLEAAEAICGGWEGSDVPSFGLLPEEILDLLSSLVDKSMVIVEKQSGMDVQYRMLKTIRQYAGEKLRLAGESTILSTRHLEYFLEWTEEAENKLQGAEQAAWFIRVELNLENLRQALRFGLDTDPQAAIQLACALRPFWASTNYRLEGIRWLRACLEKPENNQRTHYQGWALCVLADFSQFTLNNQEPLQLANLAFEICQETDDLFGQGYAQYLLGWFMCEYFKDFLSTKAHLDSALNLFQTIGNRWWQARTFGCFANYCARTGDISGAKKYLDLGIQVYSELGDYCRVAVCEQSVAYVLSEYDVDLVRGRELYEKSLFIFQRLRLDYNVAHILGLLANLVLWQGDFITATGLSNRVQDYYNHIGDVQKVLIHQEFVGRLLAFEGKYLRSIALLHQTIDQYVEIFPSDSAYVKNFVIPTIVYAYCNLGQINNAKEILKQVDTSQRLDFFTEIMLLRAKGLLAFMEGDAEEARLYLRKCLEITIKVKYKIGEILIVEGCTGALHLLGKDAEAVECLAAMLAFRKEIGASVWPGDLPFHDRVRSGVLAEIGEDDYQKYWKIGESLSLDEAALLALSSLEPE